MGKDMLSRVCQRAHAKVRHWNRIESVKVGLEKRAGVGSLMFEVHGLQDEVESFLWVTAV